MICRLLFFHLQSFGALSSAVQVPVASAPRSPDLKGRIGSLQLKQLPGRTSSIAEMFLMPTIVILDMEVLLFRDFLPRTNFYMKKTFLYDRVPGRCPRNLR